MKKKRDTKKFTLGMRKKLIVLFLIVLSAFIGLGVRLILITKNNGEEYEKQVLSQQAYDSTTLPFRRGQILDSNGSILAYSEKVYNVILDAKVLLSNEDNVEPTLNALVDCFGFDKSTLMAYIKEHPSSQYYTLAKQLSYDEISEFNGYITIGSESYNASIAGVWFEESYLRKYPNGSLACDVIGFTTSDNSGLYGLEEYYNDTLNGTAGRTYGYLNDDLNLERTTIPATDGNSIVTTIDGNIQGIVEKYLKEFNETYTNAYRDGNGAQNVGCVIMDVDTGNVLAMASYPVYDLNDTKNTDNLIGMPLLDSEGKKTGEVITQEAIDSMEYEQLYSNLNSLWKNFCISETYEPGSVAKPFTVATGIESGAITGNEVYNCEGSLTIADSVIRCHNRYGDGPVSVSRGIEISCNVAMMYIGQAIGSETFAKFQNTFGFGLKTNIDLAGEARTANLVYSADAMGPTELATGTFGQGFNVDMIEMITAFCSLINGGNLYEPHVVSKIVNASGATVENIEPRVLRQTISEDTSDKLIEMCNLVVAGEEGTGKTARPAGYMIGGKTGTAETIPRDKTNYVVSFMGYAPADDPQIAIYVVVDRPNAQYQADAKFATRIVRKVLTEVLPYLNIPMTEELTETEVAELEELKASLTIPETASNSASSASSEEDTESEEVQEEAEETETEPVWKSFEKDPETGYLIDPNTGEMLDPDNGQVIGGSSYSDSAIESGNAAVAGSASSGE
ncbi:MAG: cell division protein FtsI [Butyrivibrio sp.]|nr:cell division protein FtsI [Butyrivibrio sp.]